MEIRIGTIIQSTLFPELVKIEKIEDFGDYVRIVGATINSNQHIDAITLNEWFKAKRFGD